LGGILRDDGAGRAHATEVVTSRREAGDRRQAGLLAEREERSEVEED
jgi:hypothetical protein